MSRTKGTKNGFALDDRFKAAGYIRRDEAAAKLGLSPQTISNWIKDLHIRNQKAAGVVYCFWPDVIRKYGIDAAVIVGAITKEEAAKLNKKKESAHV